MAPGMPASLVLMAFGIYVSGKFSVPIGAVIFAVGLVLFLILWRRKNQPKE